MQKNELYLYLFHGRINPDQEMDGWGEEGPILGPFNFMQNTYGHLRFRKEDGTEFDLVWHEDLIKFQDMYYGDFTVGAVSALSDTDRKNMIDPFQNKFKPENNQVTSVAQFPSTAKQRQDLLDEETLISVIWDSYRFVTRIDRGVSYMTDDDGNTALMLPKGHELWKVPDHGGRAYKPENKVTTDGETLVLADSIDLEFSPAPGHRPKHRLVIAYGDILVDAVEQLEDMNSSFKLDMRDVDDGEIYYHEFRTAGERVAYVLGVTESAGYDNAFKVLSEKVYKQIMPR